MRILFICYRCGRKIPDKASFCPECGAPIQEQAGFHCVYECVKKAVTSVKVQSVMAYCNISREEAVTLLQRLKSMGYVAGNSRDGYWLTAKGARVMATDSAKPEEEDLGAVIEEVFNYVVEHRDTSLTQLSEKLNLPADKVKKALKKLEEQGKISLLPQK